MTSAISGSTTPPPARGRPDARGIGEPVLQVEPGTLAEAAHPVGDRLSADAEQFGDPLDGPALGEPEEGLSAAALPARGGTEDRRLQFGTLLQPFGGIILYTLDELLLHFARSDERHATIRTTPSNSGRIFCDHGPGMLIR